MNGLMPKGLAAAAAHACTDTSMCCTSTLQTTGCASPPRTLQGAGAEDCIVAGRFVRLAKQHIILRQQQGGSQTEVRLPSPVMPVS